MSVILVTGANRGIGLQICVRLNQRGDEVIAVCREAGADLQSLDLMVIEGVDVADAASVARLQAELNGQPLDVLVNNAGIAVGDQFGALDYEIMAEQYLVNALGPLRVTEALASNLSAGAKVAIVTSRVGSVGDNSSGGLFGYRASKAAANQIGKTLAHELTPRGIAVALLHPGFVATALTGNKGSDPADAARGLIARIDELTLETTGKFLHAEGYELPW